MPLYKKIIQADSKISIWKIDEDIQFFESKFSAHPEMQNESKKLQWYATRHLANEMLGSNSVIAKETTGKPYLKSGDGYISISHTASFATVMLNKTKNVGVDLEILNPKVERIAQKFLQQHEIDSIHPNEKIEKLILYWSAKEALYKLYGKGDIEFKTQLIIQPFELAQEGILTADILSADASLKNLSVHYSFFDDHVISYVTP